MELDGDSLSIPETEVTPSVSIGTPEDDEMKGLKEDIARLKRDLK
jgi:hypothetical protein